MSPVGRRPRQDGFSLMEVMVALAILASLMVMLQAILVPTLTTKQHFEEATSSARAGQAVLALMTRDLSGMYHPDRIRNALLPRKAPAGGEPGAVEARGDGGAPMGADALAGGESFDWGEDLEDFDEGFRFPSVVGTGGSGYARVTYALADSEDSDAKVLFRKVERWSLTGPPEPEGDAAGAEFLRGVRLPSPGARGAGPGGGGSGSEEDAEPLYAEVFDRVHTLRLAYLGEEDEGGGEWETRFQGSRLPRAIRVSLEVWRVSPSEVPAGDDTSRWLEAFTGVATIANH
ncbi:MAG: prepilin-type N-terminal cleavage/methylation domain-containing protein [Planctomycetes bacterium]|nr:prepilin-type N-terminal cleavage/methylation domain-containing protein [Planctomycetota bacterium]